jgi:hypothetical protein
MDATRKRAQKIEARGKPVDFKETLRMEPDGGTTKIRNVSSAYWKRWLVRSTAAWRRLRRFRSSAWYPASLLPGVLR